MKPTKESMINGICVKIILNSKLRHTLKWWKLHYLSNVDVSMIVKCSNATCIDTTWRWSKSLVWYKKGGGWGGGQKSKTCSADPHCVNYKGNYLAFNNVRNGYLWKKIKDSQNEKYLICIKIYQIQMLTPDVLHGSELNISCSLKL